MRSNSAAIQNFNIQKKIALLSVVLFLIKITAWFLTNSVAILTDALESIVNVAAGFLGLYSLYISAKPRDTDHPYGHGKVEFISAAVEGTLVLVAGIFVILNAVKNLLHPHDVDQTGLGIILVGATALVNFMAGKYCEATGRRNNSPALIAGGKHLQTDTYTTIGIIAGLVLLFFTGYAWIDPVIAILFSLIIIYTGYRIVRTSVAGIMDEADVKLITEMVNTLNENRSVNWMDVHNLRIIKYGATLHLDAHLTVPWYFNVNEAHHEIDNLSALLKTKYSDSLEIFIHSDACMPFSCPICIKPDCAVRQHEFEKRITWTVDNISANEKHSLRVAG